MFEVGQKESVACKGLWKGDSTARGSGKERGRKKEKNKKKDKEIEEIGEKEAEKGPLAAVH